MPNENLYLILLLFMSVLTFLVWGWDKAAAIHDKWRIPERTLFILVFMGGAAGGVIGMLLFRHKTRKPHFRLALWVAGILQLALFFLLLTNGG